jgi:hypothetical protein
MTGLGGTEVIEEELLVIPIYESVPVRTGNDAHKIIY